MTLTLHFRSAEPKCIDIRRYLISETCNVFQKREQEHKFSSTPPFCDSYHAPILGLSWHEVCHLLRSERAALASRAIKCQSRVIHEILRGLMRNK